MRKSVFPVLSFAVILVTAFGVFSIDAAGQSRRDIRRANQLVTEGNRSFNQRNFRDAIDKYAEAIVHVPNNAGAHFWKGLAHRNLNENELALNELNAALEKGFDKPLDIYLIRWRIHFENKNYDAALSDVNSGLAIDASNMDFRLAQGDLNFVNGRFQEALAAYEQALVATPNNAELYLNVAKIHYNLGNTDKQASAAQEAINRRTLGLADAYLLLGDAFQKKRDYPAATEAYQKALAANPNSYELYQTLAEVYRSQNRYDDAIATSRKALGVFGTRGDIYTDLSWYYSLANRHEEAAEAAKAGIKLSPTEYMAYTNLCRAYNDLERPEMAVRECNNALRIKPDDGETYFYLGRAHDLMNKPVEATQYYKRAVTGLEVFVKERPDYSDGYYLLGNAYFADNQRQKAISAYRQALALIPAFAKARYNLGFLLALEKDKGAAMEQYNALLSLDASLAKDLKVEIDKL